jgi:hypothetical protein
VILLFLGILGLAPEFPFQEPPQSPMLHGHPVVEILPVVEMGRVQFFDTLIFHLPTPVLFIERPGGVHAGQGKDGPQ